METHNRLFVLIVFVALVVSCSFRMTPTLSHEDMPPSVEPIPADVLLLIPVEFDQFVYVSSYEGREIRYAFGKAIKDQFRALLNTAFESIVIKPISSVAAAVLMMSQNEARIKDFDYVGVPEFVSTNSWVKPFEYGIEIGIRVEFFSTDKSKVIAVKGHGQGTAGIYFASALQEAGKSGLRTALISLRDDLNAKRSLF